MIRRWPWLAGAAAAGVIVAVTSVVVSRDGDDGEEPFCAAFGALLAGPLADAGTDASDPSAVEEAVAATDVLLDDLVAAAPTDGVAASAEAFAAEYRQAFEVLAAYGYDVDRVAAEATPEEAVVLDTFGQAPVDAGGPDPFGELEQVVAERCAPDVSLTTP